MGLSRYLWDLVLSPGGWCELRTPAGVTENCWMGGKPHTSGVTSVVNMVVMREQRRHTGGRTDFSPNSRTERGLI